ncbi:Appr-1-p processing protein [Halostella sp. JP-L12]|uniref:macro domain-containing protein n=1 Tax=Halostella TaxID=1843185 RepID=UPI000EF8331F|nr:MULTISPECIES: macro domain-containing protein [Halostella]NHN49398.1 Appr-1-p processing protein [Halostella sp. JP-L12]
MEFSAARGDIADREADALVSAAETNLRMEDGVASALRRAADGPIAEEARAETPLHLGEVAVTDAYDLDADYVLHAAATPSYGSEQASAESIRAATRNALRKAEAAGCESLVLPVLGTGTEGYEFAEGARIVCEAVRSHDPSTLTDVEVLAYTDSEYACLREVIAALRPDSTPSP